MSELSSLPSSSSVVKGLNLSSLLNTATNLNCQPVLFVPSYQNYVIVVGKPTNTALPLLLPVKDVTVSVASPTIRKWITNNNGIASIGCFTQLNVEGYTVTVKHPLMNFDGKGLGRESSLIYRNVLDIRKPIIVQGDYNLPCDTGYIPTPLLSGFNLGSIPSITAPVPAFDFGEYGRIFPSNTQGGIVLSIFVNDKKVVETTKTTDTSFVFNLPGTLSDILTGVTPFSAPLTPGSTISVYAVATIGACSKRSQTTTLSIPTIPILPTPEQLCREVSTRLKSATGKITPPINIIPGATSMLNISGLEDFCKTDPSNIKFISPVNRAGTISVGNKVMPFNVYNGEANIDLSRLILSQDVITTPIDKTTPFTSSTSVISIQKYLPVGYLVPGERIDTMNRGSSFKIIRPNASYFWANSFAEIDRFK